MGIIGQILKQIKQSNTGCAAKLSGLRRRTIFILARVLSVFPLFTIIWNNVFAVLSAWLSAGHGAAETETEKAVSRGVRGWREAPLLQFPILGPTLTLYLPPTARCTHSHLHTLHFFISRAGNTLGFVSDPCNTSALFPQLFCTTSSLHSWLTLWSKVR